MTVPTGGLLFLGAGASKPFGPPTMPEYPNLFRAFLEARDTKLLETYDGLRDVLKVFPEGNDLEALYSVLQDLRTPQTSILNPAVAFQLFTSKNIGPSELVEILGGSKPSETADESAKLLALLEEYILESCEIRDEAALLKSFDRLFQMLSGVFWIKQGLSRTGRAISQRAVSCRSNPPGYVPEIPVVTTNYDLAVERYLNYRQADFVDGFQRGPGGRYLLNPSVLRQQTETPSIKLVKLHGSIDWKRTADGSVVLGEGRAGTVTRRWERISGEAMVFPTRNKSALNRPFFELLSIFADFLRETEFWLVVGYSFRDEVLRRLFLDSLGEQRYMILVAPRASNAVEKLRSDAPPTTALDRIIPIDTEFGTSEGMDTIAKRFEEGF